MAEKKRKVSSSIAAPAAKKVKKASNGVSDNGSAVKASRLVAPVPSEASTAPGAAKKPRKRAADFLDDELETAQPKEKSSKTGANEAASLTVDDAHGAAEHSDEEDITISTTKKPKAKSMLAEAERTQDREIEDEWGPASESSGIEEEIDSAPALLAGFDSDNDDPAEDQDLDSSRVAPLPQYKKTSKKLRQAKQKKSEGPGVVYVGRIPHGFYESQMKEYFSQFGVITRLRLSRNKKTGASKHFAFIEFEHDEVAKIVAETMDNYLMFGHILKCKYAPEGSLHEDVWKGANKKFRRIPHHKLLKQKAEQPKTMEQMQKKMKKEQSKRVKKQAQLKELGYEYSLPELKKPEVSGVPSIEGVPSAQQPLEGALVPPAKTPNDETPAKVEEAVKASRKSKKPKTAETVSPAVEAAPSTTTDQVPKKKAKKSAQDTGRPTNAKAVLDDFNAKAKKQKVKVESVPMDKASREHMPVKGILKKPKKA